MRSRFIAAVVLSLACTVLVAITGSPAEASGFAARVSRTAPLLGENVTVSGALTPVTRVIQLQVVRSGRWVGVTSTRTRARGAYAFRVRATSATNRYRVVAPKVKRSPTRTSNVVTVRGIRPSLTFGAPVLDQTGAAIAPAAAIFAPARPGTAVRLQGQTGPKTWSTVKTVKQTSTGIARFGAVPLRTTYRVVASPGSGAPDLTSMGSSLMRMRSKVVDDQFDGKTLSANWKLRPQNFDGRKPCSQAQEGLISVAGGLATLRTKYIGPKSGCPYGAWGYPMIGTKRLSAPNGYYAARIRFQKDRGIHGGFWLQGGTEVDIVEHFGYHRPISNLLHNGSEGSGPPVGGDQPLSRVILGKGTPYTESHVYSVQWSPAGFVFRLDGVPTFATPAKNSRLPAEVVLSLSPSEWEYPTIRPRPGQFSTSTGLMQVDWVSVWQ